MKKIIMCTLLLFVSCAKEKTKELVVGMELAYPPFETKLADGTPTGISVDIAKAFGEYLGRPVRIENIAWTGLIPSLQTKKVDLLISSMTITDDRLKQVNFSDPYAKSILALLVNKNAGVNTYTDLNSPDKTIAVKQGTSGAFFVQEHFPNAKVNSFPSESAAVVEVSQGKAAAFIYDPLTIYRNYIEDTNTLTMVKIDDSLFTKNVDWGIAVNKNDPELLAQLNKFLAEFKANGGYEKLTEKYLKEEKDMFDQFDITFFF